MRISDWSSDVCSSDLTENSKLSAKLTQPLEDIETAAIAIAMNRLRHCRPPVRWPAGPEDRLSGRDGTVPITWDAAERSEEHTSELQSLMRISYAVFCLKNKNKLMTHKHETALSHHYKT